MSLGAPPITVERRDGCRDSEEPVTADAPIDGSIVLSSEFASVRVSLDNSGRGPRLKVEDLEADAVAFLDAIELASMCHATDEQRRQWLTTGPYAADDGG
jgi:hypothetical protein